jgi:hypothetical protein
MRSRLVAAAALFLALAAGWALGRFRAAALLHAGRGGPCQAGDVNRDGSLNIADPVHLLGHLFLGGPAPESCDAPAACELATVYLVRHGNRDNAPPACPDDCPSECLNEDGLARAERLASFLRDVDIQGLVGSDLCRTHQTLRPLALLKGLDILSLATAEEVAQHLLLRPTGTTTVVAHHSFTLHDILEGLGFGPEVRQYSVSGDSYDTFFAVLIPANGPPQLRVLHY